ncbi:MAG: serine/threonine protein kinase [Prevotella sp.]|nr:serine/threonine protein kinase [Prevotella sp.]
MTSITLNAGETLQGKYRIIKTLGQGGFGITYLAEQIMLNKKFAIKEFFMRDLCGRNTTSTVYTATQSDLVERYRAKFVKEAQLIAQQDHPGIVNVSDIFNENDTIYYVMEYIEGESLKDMVEKEGVLTEKTALRYISKVAEALEHLHKSHINHLDIKPANIMVRRKDDMPILIDFGVSKQYDEKKNQTSTTPPGVSNGYSPLEQYKQGGVSKFSPQADIYALGATLYKLLTGNTPPDASDVAMYGLPTLPSTISFGVRKAIEKAMKFRVADRPKSIREFMEMMDIMSTPEDEEPIITIISEGDSTNKKNDEKEMRRKEMDRILGKIKNSGYSSLSKEEKQFLLDNSNML